MKLQFMCSQLQIKTGAISTCFIVCLAPVSGHIVAYKIM
ncbi:hypothetical protein I876_07260 [Alteromonas mediterranea U7]|nr:hypothetical protein I607_06965 [Alteromonas mediterranea U4]AGP89324.1 hypothetical protein I876_07260 [Alteromonas mediterranea U7]AGP93197.1 hypothetical protein I634_07375 [Alteromonas mediterranea U8]